MSETTHYLSARRLVLALSVAGYKAYFAGGWVRDYLLGLPSPDIDIATDAPPEVLLDLFPDTILVGLAFGVVIVVWEGEQFEVATFRRDVAYSNGRKPDAIELSTAEEDALRRDFTINGMFYDPVKEEVIDYVGGREDLRLGIIRTIGNPYDRFFEDRLRMVRALRFSVFLNFSLEAATEAAVSALAYSLRPAVAVERIWNEFQKVIHRAEEHASRENSSPGVMLEAFCIGMHRSGLLPVIFSPLIDLHLSLLRQRVALFHRLPSKVPLILYLAQLFPELDSRQQEQLFGEFNVSKEEKKILQLYHQAATLITELPNLPSEVDGSQKILWTHFYAKEGSALCLEVAKALVTDSTRYEVICRLEAELSRQLSEHVQRMISRSPLVRAVDLQGWGVKGPALGALLRRAEEIAITANCCSRDEVLSQLQHELRQPN